MNAIQRQEGDRGECRMLTKDQLRAKLQEVLAENATLRRQNESYRDELHSIYIQARVALGIEAAAAAREVERQRAQEGS